MNVGRKVRRIAVVGLGSAGRRHVRVLTDLRPEIEIIAVRSGHGAACAEDGLVHATVRTVDDAISIGVDAAVIASPSTLHGDQAALLARAGCGLLIEKPLSDSLESARRLAEAVGVGSVPILVGYVLRFAASGQHFAETLSGPYAGTPEHARVQASSYLPDWRPEIDYRQSVSSSRELGGGVLLELSHEIEYVQRLLGPLSSIRAHVQETGELGISVDDSADLSLTGAEDVSVDMHLDFTSRSSTRHCVVRTTTGELTWDLLDMSVAWKARDGAGWLREFPDDYARMYVRQMEHFLRAVEDDDAPLVPLEVGIDVLRIVDAARRSTATQQEISL